MNYQKQQLEKYKDLNYGRIFKMDKRKFIKHISSYFAAASFPGFLVSCAGEKTNNNIFKIGFMLPYSGTYARLGFNIENGFMLSLESFNFDPKIIKFEFIRLDDESNPSKAAENVNKLINKDKVDVIIGTVHSGVAMGMIKAIKNSNSALIIPNAGANAATRSMCANNVFRTSFSNWQPIYPLGKVIVDDGHKNVVFVTWKYAAGNEAKDSFSEGLIKSGGKLIKVFQLPFPSVEFQSILTEIASIQPDAVACFFAGGGAVKFVKDYVSLGLKNKIPLYGNGFLTEGVLEALGNDAEGIKTTLHYSDDLPNDANLEFRDKYQKKFNQFPDVYSVQGYDAGLLLFSTLNNLQEKKNINLLISSMKNAKVLNSPRGPWMLSSSNNPVQNIYLREVKNGKN